MPVSPAHPIRFDRSTDHFGDWVRHARHSAYQRARAAGRTHDDASDIGQDVAEYALAHGLALATAYPDAAVFAAVRTFHAGVAFDRRNGAQSGQGAAFGRARTSLHAELGDDLTLADVLASDHDLADTVESSLVADALRLAVASTLDTRTARWVWDVKGHGLKVADIARRDGVSRESVSRAVNGAMRELQRVIGDFIGG